jgi:hypothetical protein
VVGARLGTPVSLPPVWCMRDKRGERILIALLFSPSLSIHRLYQSQYSSHRLPTPWICTPQGRLPSLVSHSASRCAVSGRRILVFPLVPYGSSLLRRTSASPHPSDFTACLWRRCTFVDFHALLIRTGCQWQTSGIGFDRELAVCCRRGPKRSPPGRRRVQGRYLFPCAKSVTPLVLCLYLAGPTFSWIAGLHFDSSRYSVDHTTDLSSLPGCWSLLRLRKQPGLI